LAGAGISLGKRNIGKRRICHGAEERWLFNLDVTIFYCHDKYSKLRREANKFLHPCVLTARQYGEVVLPDASTGQGPGTLARKLSRCKEGMARVFAIMVQILLRAGAIAVQV